MECFFCGKPAGYKVENQRCIKLLAKCKGLFLRKTRVFDKWPLYRVATGIPLYRCKGCPLHRELSMGDYIYIHIITYLHIITYQSSNFFRGSVNTWTSTTTGLASNASRVTMTSSRSACRTLAAKQLLEQTSRVFLWFMV